MPTGDAKGDRPIRVAFLTPTLASGGSERQMLILAAALPKESFEVRFILLSERGSLATEAEAAGWHVDTLGFTDRRCRPASPRCWRAGIGLARRYRALTANVDIVDAWLAPAIIVAAALQPLASSTILVGGRRNLGDLYRSKSWARRFATKIATRRMTAIVANSAIAATELIDNDGVDASRVHIIPNAVLPMTERSERNTIRAQWGYGPGDLVVGCVANYKPGKGLSFLIEAAANLRDRCPNLRYVLVGDGPLAEDLRLDVDRRGLRSIVRLHEAEVDARRLYPAFDLFVQSSESEGLPNVVLEAAAAGLPIVATSVGGTPEILTSERDGILVASGAHEALATGISRLAYDPELRRALGAAAEQRAAAFSAERLAGATAELYRSLVRSEA